MKNRFPETRTGYPTVTNLGFLDAERFWVVDSVIFAVLAGFLAVAATAATLLCEGDFFTEAVLVAALGG